MADAKVIAMNGERPRTPGARSVLAGAERASDERNRRQHRTTPLLAERVPVARAVEEPVEQSVDQPVDQPVEQLAVEAAPAKAAARKAVPARKAATAKKAPAKRAPARKAVAKEAPAKRAPAKRAPAQKSAARSAPPLTRLPSPPTLLARAPIEAEGPTEPDLPSGGRHSIARALVSQTADALLEAVASRARPAEIEAKVSSVLGFLRRRLAGEYELDEFGFDQEFTESIPLALLRPIYRHWFRVDVRGIENLPLTGGALIVANHSGAIPMDALMTGVAVHEEHPQRRFLRTLGADLVFQTPFLAGFARRSGATLASNPDAERLLAEGHLVGVWPEGFKGIGKPFTERYKLQRFGRGGFVSAALRTGTPIIPCSIVGAEEIYPIIGNVPSLARLLGLPYLPITPFFPLLGPLGMVPLPSKWLIEFGPPVPTDEFDAGAAEDPMLVFDLTDQIRQSIQQTLYSLLVQRRSIFF
jgi:1-acyl-sn-glycerol-3-phosphate acyltransferase